MNNNNNNNNNHHFLKQMLKALLMSGTFAGLGMQTFIINIYIPLFLQAGNSAFASSVQGEKIKGKTFALNPALVFFVMTIEHICNILISPYVAVLSERTWIPHFGRRKPFIFVGIILSVIFFVAMGYATTSSSLILLIFGWSIATSLVRPAQNSYIADLYPQELRSMAQGISQITILLFSGLASLLGNKIYPRDGRGRFFLAVGLIALSISFISFIFVRESKKLQFVHSSLYPVATIVESANISATNAPPTTATTSTTTTTTDSNNDSIQRGKDDIQQQQQQQQSKNDEDPMAYSFSFISLSNLYQSAKIIFTKKECLPLFYCLLAATCGVAASTILTLGISSYAVFVLNYSPQEASNIIVFFSAFFILGVCLWVRIRITSARWQILVFSSALVSFFSFIIFFVGGINKLAFLFPLALFAFFAAPLLVHYFPVILDEGLPYLQIGSIVGVFQFFLGIAAVIGPVFAGILIDAYGSHSIIWIVASVFLMLSTLFVTLGYYSHLNLKTTESRESISHFLFVHQAVDQFRCCA